MHFCEHLKISLTCVNKFRINEIPGRRQAIIWTNAGILLTGPLEKIFLWIVNRNSDIFIQANAFESVVWEIAAILYRPQSVNSALIFEEPLKPLTYPVSLSVNLCK